MSDFEWKDYLGLRTIEPTSFSSDIDQLWGRIESFLLGIIMVVLTVLIQLLIRYLPTLQESPNASIGECVTILTIGLVEFIFISWVMYYVNQVYDDLHIKGETHRLFVLCAIALCMLFVLFMLKWNFVLQYIWITTLLSILFITWIGCFCYFETIGLLNSIDKYWVSLRRPLSSASEDIYLQEYKLSDILQVQSGFEAMMRFLVKEFSCENLLCYVEATQFVLYWCWYVIYSNEIICT